MIENFRCIEKEELNFDDLAVIIGRNGSGKSAFLKAIDVFYNINSTITHDIAVQIRNGSGERKLAYRRWSPYGDRYKLLKMKCRLPATATNH